MLRRRFVALGIIATLAACGGGGGSSSPAGSGSIPSASTAPLGMAPASFSITIPAAPASSSANRRAPRTVPSGTESIKFTLLKTNNAGVTTPQVSPVYPLLASSPGCTSGTGGISCVIQLQAPVGTNIYLAEVFATPDGSGTHIGSGAVLLTVVANATNSASLTLAGPIAKAYVATDDAPVPNFFSDGPTLGLSPLSGVTYNGQSIPTSARVFVVALDAAGNQIISPDTFNQPVTLTLNYIQTGYVEDATLRRSPQGGNGGPTDPTTYALLSTTYAFPSGGVTSASTSSGNPSIQIESPADQTVITPLSTSTGALISITAAIGGTAQTLNLTYAILNGSCPSGETGTPPFSCLGPTPSPTPSPTPLMWPTSGATNEEGTAIYYPVGTFNSAGGTNPLPMLEFNTLPTDTEDFTYAMALSLSGGATQHTGGTITLDFSSCIPPGGTAATSQVLVAPPGPITTNSAPISITFTDNAFAPLGCIVNASDGTTVAPLQVYVDNFGITVNGKKRK